MRMRGQAGTGERLIAGGCALVIVAFAISIWGGGGLADAAGGSRSAHHVSQPHSGSVSLTRHEQHRRKHGVAAPCYSAFPQARTKTIGRTTWYNRQESVRQVVCYHFGLSPSADFPVSASMVCGMAAVAIGTAPGGPATEDLSLFADGACSGADLASDPSEPAKYVGIACSWASDLLGALVKPAGVLGSIGCAAAPSVGHALGGLLESKHEFDVAVDVMQHRKCIKYSPTHFGSPWLAVKCSQGDKGFSTLKRVSAPPVTPPTPQVPSTGPTVIYAGATEMGSQAGDLDFYEWEGATGERTEVLDAMPSDLMGYRCVVLLVNESLETQVETLLASYLHSGGTIVAIGEHEGFDEADAALNRFASSLGVGLALDDDELDYGEQVTANIFSSPLTAGVSVIGDNWVSSVSVSGAAQPLVGSAEDSEPIVGAQVVGSGQFVMAGDSNMFSDNSYSSYLFQDNGRFVRNLCP
jgi:hypothetical protein